MYTSNIASIRMFSNIALKPQVPVFFAIVFFAINLNAFPMKCKFT